MTREMLKLKLICTFFLKSKANLPIVIFFKVIEQLIEVEKHILVQKKLDYWEENVILYIQRQKENSKFTN